MPDDPVIDPRYAAAQLVHSLRAADAHTDPKLREKAENRALGWLSVIEALTSGALAIGQRRPYADMPVWVTPTVLRGGFATQEPAAGGPLLDHERALARGTSAVKEKEVRLVANGHYLTHAGLAELGATLESATYRVTVPEEGALLAVRWLIERGERESAAMLIETLSPFFDRLRFHPQSGTALPVPVVGIETPVLLASASAVAESLRRKTPSASVETMRSCRWCSRRSTKRGHRSAERPRTSRYAPSGCWRSTRSRARRIAAARARIAGTRCWARSWMRCRRARKIATRRRRASVID